MINRRNTDILDLIVLIAIVIFIFELFFAGSGLLFIILICAAGIYYGKKKIDKNTGKLLFWGGILFLGITIISTNTFKFILLSAIVYIFLKWYRSKKNPVDHRPVFTAVRDDEQTVKQDILFTNKWFGQQKTNSSSYEWQDVNIQVGIGDSIIDLNNTVLPQGEAVIFIRNIIGNIQVIVPYEMELSVHHSTFFGSADILDHSETNTWNKVIHLQTKGYAASKQRVKIHTSMLIGKIEVKRG
ncbi:cell wall-active antibiotics response protein LiaF [Sediminibacillus massiliensis]|uniref:cell wall-active antibiotics response protein LiaF n=1 Tax=Sediminibacillus massiliensis TaxID=1926277 RepID=UPI0009885014|nr:cell wall-active antibiotics response protein LiaF [Sediminibacillus massiliensis]